MNEMTLKQWYYLSFSSVHFLATSNLSLLPPQGIYLCILLLLMVTRGFYERELGNRLRNLRSYFYPWWWTDNEEWRIYFFHIKHTGGHKRLSLSIRFYLRCHHAFKNSYILTLNNVINYLMKLNQQLHTSKYKRFDKAIEL